VKACLITTNYPPTGGGVSRYNFGLVRAAGGEIKVGGIDYFRAPPAGEGFWKRLQQVAWSWRLSLSLPPDTYAIASQPHLGLGCLLARRPFAQFIHGGEWENYFAGRYLLRGLLRKSKIVVFNSEATMRRLGEGPQPDRHIVIKPGLSAVTPIRKFTDLSDRSTSSPGSLRVLSVSRLSPRKGHKKLIAAIHLMRKEGLDIQLTILGSGELLEELSALVAGHSSITIETGVSDAELLTHYDSADVFALLPEEIKGKEAWEGYGIVYLEAAARGLPILASTSGGIPEATTPEGSLLLEEDCSSREVADALRDLWATRETREQMSKANILWAGANTWAHRKALIEKLLASLTSGSS